MGSILEETMPDLIGTEGSPTCFITDAEMAHTLIGDKHL